MIWTRVVATGQPNQPMGLPGFLRESVLPYLFTRMWGTMMQIFCNFNIFFYKSPSFLRGQFKSHMDNIRWIGVKRYFSKVGWPENILLPRPCLTCIRTVTAICNKISSNFSAMLPLPDCQRNSPKIDAHMLRAVFM